MRRESEWQFITRKHKQDGKQPERLLPLVLFELLYRGLLLLFLLPALELSLRYAIRFSGYSFVTLENLVPFLCKPTTILILVLLAVLLFLFSFVEIVSLILFFRNRQEHTGTELPGILFPGIKRALSMLKGQNILGLVLATTLYSLVANIPLWFCFYLRFSMVRFAISAAMSVSVIRGILIFGGILAGLLGIFGTFTLHFCTLYGTSFRQGMKLSCYMVKKHPVVIAGRMLCSNLLMLCAETAVYGIVLLVLTALTMLLVPDSHAVVVLLKAEAEWQLYGGMIATTIGIAVNLKEATRLFFRFFEEPLGSHEAKASEELPPGRMAHRLVKALAVLVVLGNVISISLIVRNGSLLNSEIYWDTAITAHRGLSSAAPENTLSALQAAIEAMADYAEIDVQETRDGVVVLLHDYSLKRTTGVRQYIWNVDYEELSGFDCGGWFSGEYAGERIPTLEQALELCKGKIRLNIEIKDSSANQALEDKVVALIEQYEFENQCVITSTSLDTLEKVKQKNDRIKTGYIMSVAYGNFYEKEHVDFFSMKSAFVDAEVVSKAHSLGKEVHVWTVNSRNELEQMKGIGVDNIITDVPLLARQVLNQEGIVNTFSDLLRLVMQK